MCIPPSKLQHNTTQCQTLIGRSTQVSWNLLETPVLVLGRGCADLIRICPLEGSCFWFSLLLLLFGQNSGLLNEALRGGLYNRGMGE